MATDGKSAVTLAAALGTQVARRRAAVGATQDDLAREAQRVGLDWSRGVVASIETGRRELNLGEALALVLVLGRLGDEAAPAGLADLLGWGDGPVTLAGTLTVGTDAARALVAPGRSGPPRISVGTFAKIVTRGAVVGEAERVAARRLGVTTVEVADRSERLWGRTLTDERDARVAEQVPAGASPRTIQAVRGHVTRALVAELEQCRDGDGG